MKGGARSRSGPAPDPNALRRDKDGKEWIDLPASGRDGSAPRWPLSQPTKRELELWAREWCRPQAIMWEKDGQELEVALYVRAVRAAEKANAPTSARTLVRQMMEGLGISQPGMRSLRWRIVDGASPLGKRSTAAGSARDRLQVVDGGA